MVVVVVFVVVHLSADLCDRRLAGLLDVVGTQRKDANGRTGDEQRRIRVRRRAGESYTPVRFDQGSYRSGV